MGNTTFMPTVPSTGKTPLHGPTRPAAQPEATPLTGPGHTTRRNMVAKKLAEIGADLAAVGEIRRFPGKLLPKDDILEQTSVIREKLVEGIRAAHGRSPEGTGGVRPKIVRCGPNLCQVRGPSLADVVHNLGTRGPNSAPCPPDPTLIRPHSRDFDRSWSDLVEYVWGSFRRDRENGPERQMGVARNLAEHRRAWNSSRLRSGI